MSFLNKSINLFHKRTPNWCMVVYFCIQIWKRVTADLFNRKQLLLHQHGFHLLFVGLALSLRQLRMELTHLLSEALFAPLLHLQPQIQSLDPLMQLCFLLYRHRQRGQRLSHTSKTVLLNWTRTAGAISAKASITMCTINNIFSDQTVDIVLGHRLIWNVMPDLEKTVFVH